jgi:hypothetical protein
MSCHVMSCHISGTSIGHVLQVLLVLVVMAWGSLACLHQQPSCISECPGISEVEYVMALGGVAAAEVS